MLDTDHVSLFFRGNSSVRDRILQSDPESLSISIVTAEEICQGWLSEINRHTQASQSSRLLLAYAEFYKALEFFRTIQIVSFDSIAYRQFEVLRRQSRRMDTRDLRIAAIALSTNSILITRNQRDFEQIPNLQIEN
jgi:tRNA(fMet)-specific endonuclease VapC